MIPTLLSIAFAIPVAALLMAPLSMAAPLFWAALAVAVVAVGAAMAEPAATLTPA